MAVSVRVGVGVNPTAGRFQAQAKSADQVPGTNVDSGKFAGRARVA